MNLVLWIDKNDVSTALVEKVFKSRELPFYALNQVNDFSYLIKDLNPEVIVLDAQTALDNIEKFKEQYLNSLELQASSFILIDKKSGLEFIQKKIGSINRPIDPFKIPEQILSLLNELN